jgi:hypothetical protein
MSVIRDSHCYTGINVVALDAEVGMLDRRERVHDRFSCSGLVFLCAKHLSGREDDAPAGATIHI